jgi:hypothetical protein
MMWKVNTTCTKTQKEEESLIEHIKHRRRRGRGYRRNIDSDVEIIRERELRQYTLHKGTCLISKFNTDVEIS